MTFYRRNASNVEFARPARARAPWMLAMAAALLISGQAALAPPAAAVTDDTSKIGSTEVYDPFEPVNRAIFGFNRVFDDVLFKPVTSVYMAVFPIGMRVAISNVLRNLKGPVTMVNDLLQGDLERAQITLERFGANTIGGLGGVMDVATERGITYHNEDFGQTAAAHGINGGPYLMLPLLGPSTVRDAIGRVVDSVIDPFGYAFAVAGNITRAGAEGVDRRARFFDESEALEKTSLDYYASIRSLFLQNRRYEIRNGSAEPLPDLYEESDDHSR